MTASQIRPLSVDQNLRAMKEISILNKRLELAKSQSNLKMQEYCHRNIARMMDRILNGWDRISN
jgi:hypothetical protein